MVDSTNGSTKVAEALRESAAVDWRYTAEGGANIVLSYSGPSRHLKGTALRLRKRRRIDSALSHGAIQETGKVDLRFADEVIKPLLGAEQVVRMERVAVSPSWLQQVQRAIESAGKRPLERREADEIDEAATEIIVTEDLLGGGDEGVLAVEIKPKWGSLPSPTHLDDRSRPIKTRFCRFCMHAHLKLAKVDPTQALERHQNGYCPLDLYSGDRRRVSQAVDALWEAWQQSCGEANNFRLFHNGHLVSPADSDRLARACRFFGDETAADSTLRNAIVDALLTSPLLGTLKHLQSSLDPLDIESLVQVLSSASSSDDWAANAGSQPTVDEWIAWKERWDSRSPLASEHSTSPRDVVLAFLLSATFKDCSIFVQFRRDASTDDTVSSKVKAIDLDPKPVAKLPHYAKLDHEVWTEFSSLLATSGSSLRQCTTTQVV